MKLFSLLFSFSFAISLVILNPKKDINHRSIASKSKSFDQLNYDRSFLSLERDKKYRGLRHIKGRDGEYAQRVFGKLIQKAHEISHASMLNEKERIFLKYNTFLLLSLQVPMHESSLMHMTYRDPADYCYFFNDIADPVNKSDFAKSYYPVEIKRLYDEILKSEQVKTKYKTPKKLNSKFCKVPEFKKDKELTSLCQKLNSNLIRKSNSTFLLDYYPTFQKTMGANKLDVKHCSKLDDREVVPQLLFANNYADVGILMFNITSHGEMFASNKIFDFDAVVDYGINYLYEGFKVVSNHNLIIKPPDYKYNKSLSCYDGIDVRTFEGRIRVMQGGWAGRYNSGSIHNSCRYKRNDKSYINGPYKANDVNFEHNIIRIFSDHYESKNFEKVYSIDSELVKEVREGIRPLSILAVFLPEGSLEQNAYKELVENILNGTNNNKFIKQVLNNDYDSKSDLIIEQEDLKTIESEIEISSNDTVLVADEAVIKEVAIVNDGKPVSLTVDDLRDEELEQAPITSSNLISEEVPSKLDEDYTNIVVGAEINIRKSLKGGYDEVCGNTRRSKQDPIKLTIIEEDQEYLKVQFNNKGDLLFHNDCYDLDEFYIHSDFVKKVKDYNIIKTIKLNGFTSVRDGPGDRNTSVIGVQGPSESMKVIREVIVKGINNKNYLWFQYLSSDGERPWLFAGIIGQTLKTEVIDE